MKSGAVLLVGLAGLYLFFTATIGAAEPPPDEETAAIPAKTKKATKRKRADKGVVFKLDELRAEAGAFTADPGPDSHSWLHGTASVKGQLGQAWEYALGARFDGYFQTGSPDFTDAELDYTENYVRWRGESARLTLGAQNLLWGRVDEIPPADRMSRADLSRFILDELPDRRRAVPAVRLENFLDDYKIDAVWVPVFDPAEMPDFSSVWHPIDRRGGRVMGIVDSPAMAALVQTAAFREDDDGSGGLGVRVTRTGGNLDYGFSLQRSRQSPPYYRLSTLPTPVFTAVYPYSWVLGGELEMQKSSATWRLEAAYSSAVPVTTAGMAYRLEEGADLVLGTEFFPGDGETRVTLQLAGHKTFTDVAVLDRTETYSLNGEVETTFARGRWRGGLRFNAGLDKRDLYINPRLTYLGLEPHELYLAAHLFSGESQTMGGYHRDHDLVTLGWQVKY